MPMYRPHSIAEVLEALTAEAHKGTTNIGQVICIGIDAIHARLGDDRWETLRNRVGELIEKSIKKVCSPNDVCIRCRDSSVLILFEDPDLQKSEAKGAKVASMVNEALFGVDDFAGLTVQSVVKSVDGFIPNDKRNPDEVVGKLREKSKVIQVGTGPESGKTAGQPEADTQAEPATEGPTPAEQRAKIPSFRNQLLDVINNVGGTEVTFHIIPVWHVKENRVGTFCCVPKRQTSTADPPAWDYDVLGSDPLPNEYIDLDIATLEKGLIELTPHLLAGHMVNLTPNLHFETLASRKGRDELNALLASVPEQISRHLYPNIMYIPDGIPEIRLAELSSQVHITTTHLSAVIPMQKLTQNNHRWLFRLQKGGFRGITVRLPLNPTEHDIELAREASEKIREIGCVPAASWVSQLFTLASLAYSSFELISGSALGGPYDKIPAPYKFTADDLEGLEG